MHREESVCRIIFSNPDRYNAMSLAMWRDLKRIVDQADTDSGIRVIVLEGDGDKAFVSGADISEFAQLRDTPEHIKDYGNAVKAAQHALSACAKPTVASIRGICMGGGMGLALACDLRYCTHDAKFRMPAARLGLGYDLQGIQRASSILGLANTADIFMTARTFDGREAARLGMVHQSYSEAEFAAAAKAAVDSIGKNAPLTIQAVKLALSHVINPQDVAEQRVQRAIDACFASKDYLEGQKAFRNKRDPEFKGQ